MKKEYAFDIKQFANDVLKQSKPYYNRVKRLVIYKDNVPYRYDRRTGKWDYKLNKSEQIWQSTQTKQ